jgi:hypothetical protein
MHTMARMKTKKYEPYMPITERASTGLQVMSRCYVVLGGGGVLQADMVLNARASHKNNHDSSKKRTNACRDERLLPCLFNVRLISGI